MGKLPTLTITKLADRVGVSLKTMYNMIESGRVPVQPIPNSKPRRWNAEQVEKWLNHG